MTDSYGEPWSTSEPSPVQLRLYTVTADSHCPCQKTMMPLKSLGRGPPPIGAVSWNCRTPGVPHAWRAWHTFDGIELFLSLQREQLGPVLDHREQLLGQLVVVEAPRDQEVSIHDAQQLDRVGDRVHGDPNVGDDLDLPERHGHI